MTGRSWQQNNDYRFGFNGKETDPETDLQDYGFRIYNPAIAKFLSVDPLAPDYPWYTPYQFAGNMPIVFIDIDGLEPGLDKSLWNTKPVLSKSDAAIVIHHYWVKAQGGGWFKVREEVTSGHSDHYYYSRVAQKWLPFEVDEESLSYKIQRNVNGATGGGRMYDVAKGFVEKEAMLAVSVLTAGTGPEAVYGVLSELSGVPIANPKDILKLGKSGVEFLKRIQLSWANDGVAYSKLFPFPKIKLKDLDIQETGEAFSTTISGGKVSASGRAKTNGKFDFIITTDGKLVIGRNHTYMSDGADEVLAAGSLKLFDGKIRRISNDSGHYLPSPEEAENYGNLFKALGIDVKGAKMTIYKADDTGGAIIHSQSRLK